MWAGAIKMQLPGHVAPLLHPELCHQGICPPLCEVLSWLPGRIPFCIPFPVHLVPFCSIHCLGLQYFLHHIHIRWPWLQQLHICIQLLCCSPGPHRPSQWELIWKISYIPSLPLKYLAHQHHHSLVIRVVLYQSLSIPHLICHAQVDALPCAGLLCPLPQLPWEIGHCFGPKHLHIF